SGLKRPVYGLKPSRLKPPPRLKLLRVTSAVFESDSSELLYERPRTIVATSLTELIAHPFGIIPSSESSNSLGNRAAVAASMPTGSRPSALARTGSKSTNQDLNRAWAMASRVALV